MKIAFIVTQFPVLSETFILSQIVGLIDRGHNVDIYAETKRVDSKIHAEVISYDLLNSSNYIDMPQSKLKRIVKAIYLFFKYIHKNPKVLIKALNIFKFKKDAVSLYLFYFAISFIKNSQKYDVIYCHFGPNGNLGVVLRDIGAVDGKVITVFHGFDITTYVEKHGINAYKYLFREGDLFLPISTLWKQKLNAMGCSNDKIIVHRMGVDNNKFSLFIKESDNEVVKVLTIARLVEKKGVEYGIQAIAEVLLKSPNIKYYIAGDGPMRDYLEEIISIYNVKANVYLLGAKNQDELMDLLKEADILLAPSVTSKDGDQEGIPVVIMEAMAMGLPVVSTWHTGIPELVMDGVTGFLAPERDTEILAQKLYELAINPQRRERMGLAGRKVIAEHYNIEKLNDRLVKIFEETAV